MTKLEFTKAELEAEHDYATPHVECGLKLHGGFDASGQYLSPRTRHRLDAIRAWTTRLEASGVPLVEAGTALLTEPNYPTVAQARFLLDHGIEQPFWDSLTTTGLIEARGKALAHLEPPDFSQIVVEDLSGTALGHLDKGLLTSHGWDEGGHPDSGDGGHDTMWFVVRDLLFGKDRFPVPVPPESVGRPRAEREMPRIPAEHEGLITFLMNLLMIEVRAERTFDFYEQVISSTAAFTHMPREVAHACALVRRIRQDEAVHVAWLRTAISEFRAFTLRTCSGDVVPGANLLDPVWDAMVHWHAVEMHELNRDTNRKEMHRKILAAPNGKDVIDAFDRLAA